MTDNGRKNMERVEKLAQMDPVYRRLYDESIEMEARYEQAIQNLSDAQQDAVWRFVFQCETMSRRMLEIACEQMACTTGSAEAGRCAQPVSSK